ncbi:MAG: hypothetical protein ACYDD6_09475 [Acidimicrobiales bacterium]
MGADDGGEEAEVTEHKTPTDRLLELFVFGPAGLAVVVAEEFPRLVEKGRHRVEGQVHTARIVGQFAVQMGRRQIGETLGGLRPKAAPAASPGEEPVSVEAPDDAVGGADHSGRSTSPPAPAPASASGPRARPRLVSPAATVSANGTMASSVLAIPGYDSLSASQVVQRLGGLSSGELEAVRSHELAHRHRRTILNRIDQLAAATDAEPA